MPSLNLLKVISMTTSEATRSTSRPTGSVSSIGSLSGVAISCWSTIRLEIGAEAIGT